MSFLLILRERIGFTVFSSQSSTKMVIKALCNQIKYRLTSLVESITKVDLICPQYNLLSTGVFKARVLECPGFVKLNLNIASRRPVLRLLKKRKHLICCVILKGSHFKVFLSLFILSAVTESCHLGINCSVPN